MITLETIQKNIIEAIRQCGMTQTAIAKELHMSQSTIAHYVRGDILPASIRSPICARSSISTLTKYSA